MLTSFKIIKIGLENKTSANKLKAQNLCGFYSKVDFLEIICIYDEDLYMEMTEL